MTNLFDYFHFNLLSSMSATPRTCHSTKMKARPWPLKMLSTKVELKEVMPSLLLHTLNGFLYKAQSDSFAKRPLDLTSGVTWMTLKSIDEFLKRRSPSFSFLKVG